MKSDSGSAKPVNNWRLSKTLKRRVEYRPIEQDDVKYVWAAYKKGAMAPVFTGTELSADEFKAELQHYIMTQTDAVWIISANNKRGITPIGIVFACWSPPAGPHLIVTGMCWFPWATKRNVIESIVGFLNGVRKEFKLQFYAYPEHKRTYEVCAMHGVVRRVGTSYVTGKPAALFETRT